MKLNVNFRINQDGKSWNAVSGPGRSVFIFFRAGRIRGKAYFLDHLTNWNRYFLTQISFEGASWKGDVDGIWP